MPIFTFNNGDSTVNSISISNTGGKFDFLFFVSQNQRYKNHLPLFFIALLFGDDIVLMNTIL
ncbi:MAG: hypothetical protein ACI94Y_004163 [Maribacter sp.]|jgi:hypothetical protein